MASPASELSRALVKRLYAVGAGGNLVFVAFGQDDV